MKEQFRFASCAVRSKLCKLMLTCLFGICCVESPSLAAQRMPQGSFLRTPAKDVIALTGQVQSDKLVATRYARLFHLSPRMVQLAFGQLRLIQLSHDRVLSVHYVRSDGKVEFLGYKHRRVRKGTWVFALPDGTPLLIRICGNPVRAAVSSQYYTSRLLPPPAVPNFSPEEHLSPAPIPPPAQQIGVPELFPAEEVLPLGEIPTTPVGSLSNLRTAALGQVTKWSRGGVPWLPFALLPLFFLGGGNHHNSPGGASGAPPPGGTVQTPPFTGGLPGSSPGSGGTSGTPPPAGGPSGGTPPIIIPPASGGGSLGGGGSSGGGGITPPPTVPEPGAWITVIAVIVTGVCIRKTRGS